MSAYAKLPALLEQISTLESGQALCRRRRCYADAFSWLPYCEAHLEPAPFRFFDTSLDRYGLSRYALLAEYRLGIGLGMGLRPDPSSLSPFVKISAC